jgi:hypothetical protein
MPVDLLPPSVAENGCGGRHLLTQPLGCLLRAIGLKELMATPKTTIKTMMLASTN